MISSCVPQRDESLVSASVGTQEVQEAAAVTIQAVYRGHRSRSALLRMAQLLDFEVLDPDTPVSHDDTPVSHDDTLVSHDDTADVVSKDTEVAACNDDSAKALEAQHAAATLCVCIGHV